MASEADIELSQGCVNEFLRRRLLLLCSLSHFIACLFIAATDIMSYQIFHCLTILQCFSSSKCQLHSGNFSPLLSHHLQHQNGWLFIISSRNHLPKFLSKCHMDINESKLKFHFKIWSLTPSPPLLSLRSVSRKPACLSRRTSMPAAPESHSLPRATVLLPLLKP